MGSQRRMYVGTEGSLLVLAGEDGSWAPERVGLEGKTVNALVASAEAGAVFAGVAGEGVYASNDVGATWDLAFEGDVRTLALDPGDPWRLYAGTEPAHLFRSDDAGDSWIEVDGLQRLPEEVRDRWWFPQPPHEGHVLSICVDPRDSRVILVGLEHGGIYRTDDAGDHWEDLSAGIEYLDIHMVGADPVAPELCYASTARGFYRSEDSGRSWDASESGLTRDYFHDLVVRGGPASTLFLATANGIPPSWLRTGRAQAAIFRSQDAGRTWQQLTGGLPDSLERMVWAIVGDPLDEARIYAGTGDYSPNPRADERPIGDVWASANNGDTWARVYETPSPIRSMVVAAP